MDEPKPSRLSILYRSTIVELGKYFKNALSLKDGLDKEGTKQGILDDVEFKGHGAWILLLAALIASIGLSIGSTAVIIGAMLISPLMGPILGIGFAAATNNFELLTKALKNFGMAVLISIIISTIYFLILPVPHVNNELLDRKTASILAIAIAFFGGAAGIIAGSRTYKSNVVPGVAIATALMPPLCTVGYGLATMQVDFILGAFYLFFINSVFIALPTYLYIRYQRFPMVDFISADREKKMNRYIAVFLIVTIIPSAFIFVNVLSRSFFMRNAEMLIDYVNKDLEGTNTFVVSSQIDIDSEPRRITLAMMGDVVSDQQKASWRRESQDIGLNDCEIDIRQSRDYAGDIAKLRDENSLSALQYTKQFMQEELYRKSAEVDSLKQVVQNMEERPQSSAIAKQVFALFPELKDAGFSKMSFVNSEGKVDTLSAMIVRWNQSITSKEILESEGRMRDWLQVVYPNERIEVMTMP